MPGDAPYMERPPVFFWAIVLRGDNLWNSTKTANVRRPRNHGASHQNQYQNHWAISLRGSPTAKSLAGSFRDSDDSQGVDFWMILLVVTVRRRLAGQPRMKDSCSGGGGLKFCEPWKGKGDLSFRSHSVCGPIRCFACLVSLGTLGDPFGGCLDKWFVSCLAVQGTFVMISCIEIALATHQR